MRDVLNSLAGCKDVASLKSAIHELCTGLGENSQFDVMTLSRPGKHQALCLFHLESAALERQLIASIGASRFGNDLLLVVDLPAGEADFAEPRDGFQARANEPRQCRSAARRVLDWVIEWPGTRQVR